MGLKDKAYVLLGAFMGIFIGILAGALLVKTSPNAITKEALELRKKKPLKP